MNNEFRLGLVPLLIVLLAPNPINAAMQADLSFAPQTGFTMTTFDGERDIAAVAGRDDNGVPRLALIQSIDGELRVAEMTLPEDAVAIDTGAISEDREALFILCAKRVFRLDQVDADLAEVAAVESLYRGRSYAPLTASLDFASDIDNDGVAELLIQDFDELTVLDGEGYADRARLTLPTLRRSFERAQNFRPVRTASIPDQLISVRGDQLLRYPLTDRMSTNESLPPVITELGLGLSSERDIERFYNGDPELDQRDVTLREPELLVDINGDDLPDLVTLETVSSGVFEKETTYRLHLARTPYGYNVEPDTVFSGEGYQFGLRAVELNDEQTALVAPGVKIGLRAIIGALFSRSVNLDIAIFAADETGQFPAEASTEVRAKVKFDFGSGQAELPTITFGDIDGDGQRDLILKRGRDQLGWRRNLGGGSFASKGKTLDIAAPKDGSYVVAADFDGDGRDELLVRYGLQDGAAIKRRVGMLDPEPVLAE